MQLGTRWAMGSEPPARLPEEVVSAIRELESAEASHPKPGAVSEPNHRRWTLTWLEGRPIVELDPAPGSDDVTIIQFDPATRAITMKTIDADDEWVEEEL